MTNKKKFILKIAGILIVVLIVCTFVSRTIYTMLLPIVQTDVVGMGTIDTWAATTATFGYTDVKPIKATDNLSINEVKFDKGQIIAKGAELFSTEVGDGTIQTKRLQLAILQLQNQLIPNTLSDASKAEIEMEIRMAQNELTLYQDGIPYNNYVDEERLKQNIKDIENSILQANSNEQLSALNIELKIAKDKLAAYLKEAKESGIEDKAKEDELRLAVANIYARLEQTTLSLSEREKLESQLKIAKEQQMLYQTQRDMKNQGQQERLELALLKLNNQLTQPDLSPQKINEINLQIQIAKLELADYKAKNGSNGVITSALQGIITNVFIKDGDNVTKGQNIAEITTETSKRCLNWTMSYEAGNVYGVHSAVNASFSAAGAGSQSFGQNQTVIETEVTKRTYDEEKQVYHFTAELPEEQSVPDETVANIKLIKKSASYLYIVPTTCLVPEAGGKFSLFLIENRQGFFTKETYVRKVSVEIEEKNNFSAAIMGNSFNSGAKIVKYASKYINDGDVVSVVQ